MKHALVITSLNVFPLVNLFIPLLFARENSEINAVMTITMNAIVFYYFSPRRGDYRAALECNINTTAQFRDRRLLLLT